MAVESKYVYGGSSDVGLMREVNEDYFGFHTLSEDVLLCVVADGMGSKPSTLQPGAIAAVEVIRTMQQVFEEDKELVLNNPCFFLKYAMLSANRVLGAFKMANEEQHAGFGCSISCVLLYDSKKIAFAHCGNTRINLIRLAKDGGSNIYQLSVDHTRAMELLQEGTIAPEDINVHPGRLELTSGLGFILDPVIQTYTTKLKANDILLITTKGIHYGIRSEFLSQIVLAAQDWEGASISLINAARLQQVADNMTAALMYIMDD